MARIDRRAPPGAAKSRFTFAPPAKLGVIASGRMPSSPGAAMAALQAKGFAYPAAG